MTILNSPLLDGSLINDISETTASTSPLLPIGRLVGVVDEVKGVEKSQDVKANKPNVNKNKNFFFFVKEISSF